MCLEWPEEERAQLADFCKELLRGELGSSLIFNINLSNIPLKEEAIRTLALCGDAKILDQLKNLHDIPKFRTALVFAHSRSATQTDWLVKILIEDVRNIKRGAGSSIGDTANALCCMFKKYPDNQADKNTIIKFLHEAVFTGRLNDNELISCILAIGVICGKREDVIIDGQTLALAEAALDEAYELTGGSDFVVNFDKAINIARNLISGVALAQEEQEFLLERIDKA